MKDWPANPAQIVPFSDLLEPLLRALHAGVHVTPRREALTRDIPYDGYTLGDETLATSPDPERTLPARVDAGIAAWLQRFGADDALIARAHQRHRATEHPCPPSDCPVYLRLLREELALHLVRDELVAGASPTSETP